jgi:hypothetical protein
LLEKLIRENESKQYLVMNRLFRYNLILILFCFLFGCQPSKNEIITSKTNCYNDKLKNIREDPIYNKVMAQFVDTFEILKTNKGYFGVPEIVENKPDDAIFFKKDKTECLLIVLRKNNLNLVFGNATIIRGIQINGKWTFEVNSDYTFDKDYFGLYRENSFENISKLARYSILTDRDVKMKGCEIDDHYWFKN